jgi:hypothetical protein
MANPVQIRSIPLPLCGISTRSDTSNQLALRQYLSHFSRIDLDETSLEPRLGIDGNPCIRPVVRNTSVKLIHRAVELGYAEWNPSSGMLDFDTWMINLMYLQRPSEDYAAPQLTRETIGIPVTQPGLKLPWMQMIAALFVLAAAVLLFQLSRLSSLLIRRTSVAGLLNSEVRSKLRGIAIPTVGALQIAHTDIQAIAFLRTTEQYGHNGWRVTGRNSEQVACSIDDGTACIDVDLTHANVHFSNRVSIYNGIPGEHLGRTPYMDDTRIVFQYIPVGAVVTLIGTLVPHDTCYRAMKNVHVYDGDERAEVRVLKFRVLLCIGVLLVISVLVFILRPGR